MVARTPRAVSPRRARILWTGNLCLAAGFLFLAIIRDDSFGRALALFLVVLSLAIAATWFQMDRRARRSAAGRHDQPN